MSARRTDAPAARWFDGAGDGNLRCRLCPHRCVIAPGRTGACGVRGNDGGRPALPRSGHITALAVDPIEKKPLYHYRPGTEILSAGFSGCNLRCPFCQNWHISQNPGAEGRGVSAAFPADEARRTGLRQIAWTYSEPLVHGEFLLAGMAAAREAGVANVLVTNGCVEDGAAGEFLALCDAANVDLKSFSAKTYREILGGDLETVKNFIRAARETGVHLEITTLVVPGLNDSEEELDEITDFVAGLGGRGGAPGTAAGTLPPPWHLSAYHPDWRWDAPPTDAAFLRGAAERARRKLPFVYTGNIGGEADTACPYCGKILVKRRFRRVDAGGLENRDGVWHCGNCGERAPFAGLPRQT